MLLWIELKHSQSCILWIGLWMISDGLQCSVAVRMYSTTCVQMLQEQSGWMGFRPPLDVLKSGQAQNPISHLVHFCTYHCPLVIGSTKTCLNIRCEQGPNVLSSKKHIKAA